MMPQSPVIEQILEKEGERFRPLLHYILKRSNPELAASIDKKGRIAELRLRIAARNFFLLEELRKMLQALAESGIEVILLKGARMQAIYPSGLRPFNDIDFLIQKEKLYQALAILHGLGYESSDPHSLSEIGDVTNEVALVKRGHITAIVEPHWTLGTLYPWVETQGLWHRARRTAIASIETLVLSPEDALLHTCLHLFAHRLGGWLASSCDIAELICHQDVELDWEAFLRRVFEFRTCLPVQYSLRKSLE